MKYFVVNELKTVFTVSPSYSHHIVMATCQHDYKLVFALLCIILAFTLTLLTIYVGYKYIVHSKHPDNKPEPLVYWTGIFFIVVTAIQAIQGMVRMSLIIAACYKIPRLLDRINTFAYCVQRFALGLVLFVRIYIVFKDSVFELSQCTIYIVGLFFICIPVLALMAFLPIWKFHPRLHQIIIGFIFLCSIVYAIWITSFFVYKLVKGTFNIYHPFDISLQAMLYTLNKSV